MSVRKNTNNRMVLYRVCHICGRTFRTTAENPFIRQLPEDGKKQKTCYFCCEDCWRASYKHTGHWDGLANARRKAREATRDTREKNRKYYASHAERERQRARERYWSDQEAAREDNRYQRKKRKLRAS